LDETEYVSATITEADKGTVAILSTLDKLDRQVEEVSKEITAYVILVIATECILTFYRSAELKRKRRII
jgi:hypothetical protein